MRPDCSPVPVKLTVKQFIGSDWMVACMVPKGNMMHCMLREVEGAVKQLKYSITGKEIPVEIMEIETQLSQFFEGEIKNIKREGQNESNTPGSWLEKYFDENYFSRRETVGGGR